MVDVERNDSRWTLRDAAWVIGLGAAFGVLNAVAFVPFSVKVFELTGGNRPLESLINGIWMLGGFVPIAVVRKPGALLVGETVAAFVEICINACPLCAGTGFMDRIELAGQAREVLNPVFFSGVLQGMGGEMVFCLTRYVRWDLSAWLLAACGTSAFSWMSGIYVTHSYISYPAPERIAILVTSTVGVVLLAGVGGWWISRRLHGQP